MAGRDTKSRAERIPLEYRFFGMLRLFLALLVAFQHFGIALGPEWARRIGAQFIPGSMAVLAFYSLSGFIMMESISHIYLRRPGAFIANRAVRILIPFAIGLTFSIGAHWILLGAGEPVGTVSRAEAFSALNLTANFVDVLPFLGPRQAYEFLPIFWAVRYELAFYLVCLSAILLARGRPERFRGLMLGFVGVTVGGDVLMNVLHGSGTTHAFVSALVTYFALGVSMYFAGRGDGVFSWALVAVGASCVHAYIGFNSLSPSAGSAVQVLSLLTALLLLCWRLSFVNWPRMKALDIRCGDLSYPVYLLHFPVILLLRKAVPNGAGGRLLLGFVASILLSLLFAWLVEPSIAGLRNRIRGRKLAAG